jgi:hypothetical protein
MKYILMMHAPGGPYKIAGWSPEDFQATAPDQAKVVRAAKDGEPITDGIFPESKEFLVGYWIIDVDNPEQAYRIAARASAAPGPSGVPLNMAIEVRQIMSGPPDSL